VFVHRFVVCVCERVASLSFSCVCVCVWVGGWVCFEEWSVMGFCLCDVCLFVSFDIVVCVRCFCEFEGVWVCVELLVVCVGVCLWFCAANLRVDFLGIYSVVLCMLSLCM